MFLHEDKVKNAVVAKLAQMHYLPRKVRTINEQGVDIVARHQDYGRFFYVEVKGDPGKNVKSSESGREVRFIQSVGQLITRIVPERGYNYGLAYPSSYRQKALRRLPASLLKTLKIFLFFVDNSLEVEVITWRQAKRLQESAK